ncbi:glutaminyl-peptide cyclotransferase [Caulobacter sp. RL271]|uniref:Glutaminyl-peptide cyclotransferase n=1 Tax=Caulobacter segnis TaxID=88688 RepID=A0ABY4ZPX6_9CAUL|nr:glutaminyl-peptide cyclotransferase [Caulobacter segnis]USQ94730.1 glutaminyl-peptide cyclotransferase [Caulobacter segnis]
MRLLRRLSGALLAVALTACAPVSRAATAPVGGYTVVKAYPHDANAFTEGLFYRDGFMFESTGLKDRSFIRKWNLETGFSEQERLLDSRYFGEGIVDWKNRLYELTWTDEIGFIYDIDTFEKIGEFSYPGEGWALTRDDKRLIMSDGTSFIRFLDPETLKETGRIEVTDHGVPVRNLNELEYVKGELLANVWQTTRIARINLATGEVTGWVELAGLLKEAGVTGQRDDVLNGIAYDAARDRLFVTGKLWPKLFEIKLLPPK